MPEFSYQLYCSRNFPPLTRTLRMVADAGYKNVEGYGALYADKDKVAELIENLAAAGLKMPTGHFGIDQLETEPDRVLEIAEAVALFVTLEADRPGRFSTNAVHLFPGHDAEIRFTPDAGAPADATLTLRDLYSSYA